MILFLYIYRIDAIKSLGCLFPMTKSTLVDSCYTFCAKIFSRNKRQAKLDLIFKLFEIKIIFNVLSF